MKQPGEQGGRAVECVRGRHRPPTVSDAALFAAGALARLTAEPLSPPEQPFSEAARHLGAADPRQMVEVVGHDLNEMTVAVDDRMAESILDLLGLGCHHNSCLVWIFVRRVERVSPRGVGARSIEKIGQLGRARWRARAGHGFFPGYPTRAIGWRCGRDRGHRWPRPKVRALAEARKGMSKHAGQQR